jgi:hypothetical protein
MSDLENRLHSALHDLPDPTAVGAMSGPALRRKARARTLRARTGGAAVVGAAAVTGVVVAPSLISTPSPRSTAGAGAGGAPSAAAIPAPTVQVTDKSAGTDPAGKAQPASSFTGKATSTATAAPTQRRVLTNGVWDPAGALVADPTVLAAAPKVAATDADWKNWGGQLLDRSTVKVVFADRALIRGFGPDDLRPLVVVTGRTSAQGPLQLAVLTSVAGGGDAQDLSAIGLEAMTPVPADGPQAIAVSNGLTMYVAAETGIDSATYTYRDDSGEHTAAMKVSGGVAVAPTPMADLKASAVGAITNIRAVSHGKVVWDGAPVAGR